MAEFFEKLGKLSAFFQGDMGVFAVLAFLVLPTTFFVQALNHGGIFLLAIAIAFIIAYLATKIREKFLYLYFGIVAFFLYMLSIVSAAIDTKYNHDNCVYESEMGFGGMEYMEYCDVPRVLLGYFMQVNINTWMTWIFLTIILIASLVFLIRGYRENHTSYTNADLERICEGIKFDDEEMENTQKEDK